MTSIGFAPTDRPSRPRWGTPPICPERDELHRSRDILADSIREKAPFIAAILTTPVGCDTPEQGGFTGMDNMKNPPFVCYLA